jgi:hypothetical protein
MLDPDLSIVNMLLLNFDQHRAKYSGFRPGFAKDRRNRLSRTQDTSTDSIARFVRLFSRNEIMISGRLHEGLPLDDERLPVATL